jgi:ABC-2 type transport system permease protein
VRSHVAFEEASIDLARRRAERVQALRDGRSPLLRKGTARPAPFTLAPRGPRPVAFLWQGLIALGPAGQPRNAAILVAVLAALVFGLARTPWAAAVGEFGSVAMIFAASVPLIGSMAGQRSLRDTLDRLDIFKAMPVPGWHVAFGQMLTPVLLIVALQWLLLFVAGMACLATGQAPLVPAAGVAAMLMVTPPLAMLILCLPFAGVLWFPAWAGAISSRGGGYEAAGQRLVFGIAFMFALMLVTLPAGAIGGGAWALGWYLDHPLAGLLAGGLLATAVVVAELAFALRLLGQRIDRFDLSAE